MAAKDKPDPRVTKRRVTMTRSRVLRRDEDGVLTATEEAVDYVRPDFLDAYLAKRSADWDLIEVSEEPDAGPAGYEGATWIPADLDHPEAHTYFPATGCKNCKHAPEVGGVKATVVRGEG